MASQTVVIVEEELDGIRDLVDLPRLMFIDEECRNLIPIQDGLFRGCSWMWRPKRSPSLKSVTLMLHYNDETWHSYTLPKENPKAI